MAEPTCSFTHLEAEAEDGMGPRVQGLGLRGACVGDIGAGRGLCRFLLQTFHESYFIFLLSSSVQKFISSREYSFV